MAGFRCRGYQDPFVPSQIPATHQDTNSLVLLPFRSSYPAYLDQGEYRSFELCRTKLIPHLGGALEFGFWESLVLQMSHTEPSVRHSLIALGSMFEQSRTSQFRAQQLNDSTIRAYNNALTITSRRTEAPDGELVALITCVLFLCIEFMQGNKPRALDLLRHGQTVLRKHLQFQSDFSARINGTLMNDMIIPIYERLAALSALHGRLLPPLQTGGPSVADAPILSHKSFSSVSEASKTLYPLCIEGNKFIKKTRSYNRAIVEPALNGPNIYDSESCTPRGKFKHRKQTTEEIESVLVMWTAEQSSLLSALEKWLAMVQMLSETRSSPSIREQQLEKILLMWHATAIIRVKSSLHASETSFNEYSSLFEAIVDNAEGFLTVAASNPGISDFTFEMGVLPPLFFTALKCRYPNIRQRSIAAMRRGPRKEGLWDREELLAVSQKLIDLEHSGLSSSSDLSVPVQPRVCDVKVGPSNEQDDIHVTFLMIDEKPELGRTISEALLHLHEDL